MKRTIVSAPMGARAWMVFAALSAGGCAVDPGGCDELAAREVYYDEEGFPAYAGQALLEVSCGQARYCHATDIPAEARFGVPVGLELDVGIAVDASELPRLAHARRVAWNLRGEILHQVDVGAMPPGPPSGDEALAGAPRYRTRIGTPEEHGLPAIDDPAAREMLRNWLACGAHVVEADTGSSTGIGDIVPSIEVLRCAPGELGCDGSCIDVTSNPASCGACGRACGPAQDCVAGACVCASGLTACGADCADLSSDVAHCGACDVDCGLTFCADAACVASCPAGRTDCGGSCVDLSSSASSCGACGNACRPGESCAGGSCSCAEGLTRCGAQCVALTSDVAHCGACDAGCADGASCTGGACTCAAGTTACGDGCADLSTDPQNCGACGNACGAGGGCTAGSCVSCGPDVSYARDIEPIFTRACLDSGCHGGARPAAGISLELGRSFAELTGSSSMCGGALVVPAMPERSYLMNKLTDVDICSGTLMPKRGQSLPAADIALIRSWICQGASND